LHGKTGKEKQEHKAHQEKSAWRKECAALHGKKAEEGALRRVRQRASGRAEAEAREDAKPVKEQQKAGKALCGNALQPMHEKGDCGAGKAIVVKKRKIERKQKSLGCEPHGDSGDRCETGGAKCLKSEGCA
jgi:hypothetical protein